MCFHVSLSRDRESIENRFNASFLNPSFEIIYHVSAFSFPKLPVISNEDPSKIQFFSWGLIPLWVKDSASAFKIREQTLNAKAETISVKPSFRHSIKTKRCLVLADGFFEWHHLKNQAFPYYIQLKDHPLFAIAGIWDAWTNKETNDTVKTFSVITTQANPLLAEIHNTKKRMPVILHPADEKKWLSDIPLEQALGLLTPYDEKKMEAHTVSKLITTRGVPTNVAEVMRPYRYPGVNLPVGD